MKSILKGAMIASVAAMGLGLAACDSKQENAAEDQAQAVRESADATGDAMEEAGENMGGASGAAMEEAGENMKNAGEKKADQMEDNADKMDKTPG